MFVDISVVVEKPRDLFCVTIHCLKILLFTESDDRSQNTGKAKRRTFLTNLIVSLVNFFPEFSKAFFFWRSSSVTTFSSNVLADRVHFLDFV